MTVADLILELQAMPHQGAAVHVEVPEVCDLAGQVLYVAGTIPAEEARNEGAYVLIRIR